MYVTLRSIGVEDSMKKRTYKAKLQNTGDIDITITIKAETKEDLKRFLRTIKKGAVFELKLEPISSINERSLDDFVEFEGD
ncbi:MULTISPECIES: hypothetical protein [unclassified Archaeoglobus]|jgi:acylphosphatase|uniref:hypothetical protein n=1 Tax=unclassified Archaeoglobus TaxID=2643606 RepID=UPI0025C33037|nr:MULTISPECIES: hypothetical protein [unclassified Archaeoglobus]